ncbi:MAG TPA: response regulator [Candidatus Saccharimonadales bacterium]|nr:response regulator [Candidatus Saccharimonadales bacterium]
MAKARILYIEDYPVVQTMYVEVLQKHFSIDVASDGKEALEKIKLEHYDVILLDLLLPQVSGMEFLREYQKGGHKQDDKTHLIVLSDFDNPGTQKEVRALGIKDYWIKVENTPYVLVEKLNEVLASKPD